MHKLASALGSCLEKNERVGLLGAEHVSLEQHASAHAQDPVNTAVLQVRFVCFKLKSGHSRVHDCQNGVCLMFLGEGNMNVN